MFNFIDHLHFYSCESGAYIFITTTVAKKARAYTYLKKIAKKKIAKKKIKKKLLASFAFVHACILPKVIYCQCRLVLCSE